MPEQITEPLDPIAATLARLADLGHVEVSEATVAAAWQEALRPELESRVGRHLSSRVTATELDEFGALIDADDHDGAGAWLDVHAPDHREVGRGELARLIDEAVAWFPRALSEGVEGADR